MIVTGEPFSVRFNIKPTDEEGVDVNTWDIVTTNPQTDNSLYDGGGDTTFKNIQKQNPTSELPGYWMGDFISDTGYNKPGIHIIQLVRPEGGGAAGDNPYHVIASIMLNVVEKTTLVQVTSEYWNPQT